MTNEFSIYEWACSVDRWPKHIELKALEYNLFRVDIPASLADGYQQIHDNMSHVISQKDWVACSTEKGNSFWFATQEQAMYFKLMIQL